jgi:CRISPR-associated protein Cas2
MFSVVCYDIPDDGKRNRVGKILEGFGERVQKSVFECDLKIEHLKLMQQKLSRVIGPEDSIRYYHLCAECIQKIVVLNGPPVTHAQLYFTV